MANGSTISEWRGALPALTTDQMHEVDRATIQDIGITLIQMMENAGRHLATLAREKLEGNVEGKRIVVPAGRGNNGGGGLVAARRLANWGADVCVVLAASPNEYHDVPAHQLAILQKMGVETLHASRTSLRNADLILDALIGYGLRGTPKDFTADLIRQANRAARRHLPLRAVQGLSRSIRRRAWTRRRAKFSIRAFAPMRR